jgi:epoxyqueuosine reductase
MDQNPKQEPGFSLRILMSRENHGPIPSLRKTKQQTRTIRKILDKNNACCIGFADISGLELPITYKYPFGICFGLHYDDEVVNQLPNDESWIKMSSLLTEKAGRIYKIVQMLIETWGFHSSRVPSTTHIDELPEPGEDLPQKTIATLAGLGWIGKSTLLINPIFGPRIRPGALLTDMPLETDTPVILSSCGDCKACVDICPVGAIKGNNWSQGTLRNELFDVSRCYNYRWSQKANLGRRIECGLCLKACPVGKKLI